MYRNQQAAFALSPSEAADYFNHEHYPDPTAWKALCRIERQQEMDNYEQKVLLLQQYRRALEDADSLADQLLELRCLATQVSPALTGLPRSGADNNRLPRAVERIQLAQRLLEKQIDACLGAQKAVLFLIGQVPDRRQRNILRLRYLNGQFFEDIATQMNLDERWVRRLHRRAVEKLVLLDDPTGVAQG